MVCPRPRRPADRRGPRTAAAPPEGGADGFGLARAVAERWPDIGILVASGRARAEEGDMPDGAVFVAKPFSADVIYDRIHVLLPDGKKPEPLKRKNK